MFSWLKKQWTWASPLIEWIENHPIVAGVAGLVTSGVGREIYAFWNDIGPILDAIILLILIGIGLFIWSVIRPNNTLVKYAVWIVSVIMGISVTFYVTREYYNKQIILHDQPILQSSTQTNDGTAKTVDPKHFCEYTANDAGSENYSIPVGGGTITLMTKWVNLIEGKGIGEKFFEKLNNNRHATWYILNYSPYALQNNAGTDVIFNTISNQQDRQIKIEWAFQTPSFIFKHKLASLMQHFLLNDKLDSEGGQANKSDICVQIQTAFNVVKARVDKYTKQVNDIVGTTGIQNSGILGDKLSIYFSRSPNFYFAWISVPDIQAGDDSPLKYLKYEPTSTQMINTLQHAPPGTFGFVMFYAHFPQYDYRPAIYFEKTEKDDPKGRQSIIDYYTISTLKWFEHGLMDPSQLFGETNQFVEKGESGPYLTKIDDQTDWSSEELPCGPNGQTTAVIPRGHHTNQKHRRHAHSIHKSHA